MTGALGEVLIYAIAAALTPTAILLGLLLLLTPRPRSSGGAFLGGWLLGLWLSAAVLLRLGTALPYNSLVENEPRFRPAVVLLAGLVLVVSGIISIRARRRTSTEPAWLRRVDSLRPIHALGIGFGLAALSPKLVLLTAATLAVLTVSGASRSQEVVGLALYIVVATLPIAVPVVVVFAEGERAPQRLLAWKTWLIGHQGILLGGGSLLLGLLLVVRAYQLIPGSA